MQRSRIRPDPVSCESCRAKKLKCTRIQPCSNCSARGITCMFLVRPQKAGPELSIDQSLVPRLERLESTVASLQQQLRAVNGHTSAPAATASVYHLDNSGGQIHNDNGEDVGFLENIGTRDDALLCDMSGSLAYEIRSVPEILQNSRSKHSDRFTRSKITLPQFSIASQLLQTYETSLRCWCPIVHIPTIRSLLKTTYLRLNTTTSLSASSVAVLLSLFALGAFFTEPSPMSEIATTEAGSIALSKELSKGALDVLDYSRRKSSGTLEDVQAYILMSLALSQIDGFSTRSRMLFSSALSMARDLRLHRLDEVEPSTSYPTDPRLLIQREIQRRVFWYIASEDWLQSTISGPQEGTYWIQNSYIKVNLPRNCIDDELALGHSHVNTSEDAPTHMMVYLERIRLAHICREITDTIPLDTNALLQMPYEHIIALDQKLEQFLATMPLFLQHDFPNREVLESIYPQLPSWRYCIAKTALSRRWKLNQRFLLRQHLDPRYTYSRQACVKSARAVISGYTSLAANHTTSALLTRMGIAIHFTHLALSILVMDLCCNQHEADVVHIREDIKAAFKIFADAATVSPLLAKSLASLKAVLQRNNIDLYSTPYSDAVNIINNEHEEERNVFEPSEQTPLFSQDQCNEQNGATNGTLDSFWDIALHNSGDIDLNGWDDLFSNLDSRPI